MSKKINDFGNKIGGARKDFFANALNINDLANMNEAERNKLVKKDNVWPKPNYQKLFDEGMDKRLVYFIKTVRDACPCKPAYSIYQEDYIEYLTEVKNIAESTKCVADIENFWSKVEARLKERTSSCSFNWKKNVGVIVDYKFQRRLKYLTLDQINRGIKSDMFLYTQDQKDLTSFTFFENDEHISFFKDENNKLGFTYSMSAPSVGYWNFFTNLDYSKESEFEKGKWFAYLKGDKGIWAINCDSKEDAQRICLGAIHKLREAVPETETIKKKGKTAFIPKSLLKCERVGKDYLGEHIIITDDMLNVFNFYGGEFGNWVNDDTRQENLNQSYLAFADLARALDISADDISFNNKLSIAYGARGKSNAAAHYESLRRVINLTKMKGAGNLAHEWGHALDNYLGQAIKGSSDLFLTETSDKLIVDLVNSLKFKTIKDDEAKKYYTNLYKQRKHDYIEGFINFNLFNDKFNDEARKYVSDSIDALVDYRILTYEDIRKYFEGKDYIVKEERFYSYVMNKVRLLSPLWVKAHDGKEVRVETEFNLGSQYFDTLHSKNGHKDYWSSDVEMFARAFSCYVKDKLGADKDDYLCGQSDCFAIRDEAGDMHYAYPRGEEREQINAKFDKLFKDIKEMGLLNSFNENDVNFNHVETPSLQESKLDLCSDANLNAEQMSLFGELF